jgi:hypothetical protein
MKNNWHTLKMPVEHCGNCMLASPHNDKEGIFQFYTCTSGRTSDYCICDLYTPREDNRDKVTEYNKPGVQNI